MAFSSLSIFFAVLLVGALGVLFLLPFEQLDQCLVPGQLIDKSVDGVMHSVATGLVVFTCLLIGFWRDPTSPGADYRPNWTLLYRAAHCYLWFQPSLILITAMKEYLNDKLCNPKHANSVSGHTCYYTYFALTLSYCVVSLKRDPNQIVNYFNTKLFSRFVTFRMQRRALVYTGCVVLVYAFAIFNLGRTLFGGYHSPRQMLYGFIFGISITFLFTLMHPSPSDPENIDGATNSAYARWREELTSSITLAYATFAVAACYAIKKSRLFSVFTIPHLVPIFLWTAFLVYYHRRRRNEVSRREK